MLTKESRIPLHMQMADEIRAQIRRRELLPNDRLPSERELCERYNISRITVRKALGTLGQEGLIHSTIGKGNFVAQTAFNEELQPLSSFTQDMARRGMQASSITLSQAIIPADDSLSEKLGIPRGAEVVRLHRLRLADGLPIAIQLTHLPHHLCPNLLDFNFSDRSLYDILQNEYKLVLARSGTEIMAALAHAEEANLLKLKQPAAVLISEQTTYLENRVVIEMTRSIFNADRYKLHTHSG
jgi:GntR family transcriptional regulator